MTNTSHSSNKTKIIIGVLLLLIVIIVVILVIKNIDKTYGFNQTFKFSNLEITLGDKYSIVDIDGEYTSFSGKQAVRLPVTVKNIGKELNYLSMFDYTVTGSTGKEVNSASVFFDDSVDLADDLEPGEKYTMYFYFVYDGDGKYTMTFDNISENVQVEFNISK